ncbi:hypothetical protein EGI16_03520 [Chryseobacterium sp. G0240]|uniref:hypothetical protein n=1 Tax=Chryseobacterium sp. G0240 TaxID=2487066 RepID=UPI000F45AA14|nr:hypothetical protein [Chryseobacterium sp. G0240]ROI05468.1 hypothetical protein EGI16_03520 [Chryseobacterium sp. G0240]
MQIEIKKSKLTLSILNQIVTSSNLSSFDDFKPLGWVLTKKNRFHVFIKDGTMLKMPYSNTFYIDEYFKQIDEHGTRKKTFKVRIVNSSIHYIEFDSEIEASTYVQKYKELINSSLEKGQFYL